MTWIILALTLSLVLWLITAGIILKLRQEIDYLSNQFEYNFKKHFDELEENVKELDPLKEKIDKEKWKNFKTAFGGKEEGAE